MQSELYGKMLIVAESFNKWLEEISKEVGLDKDTVQALIKQFLIG